MSLVRTILCGNCLALSLVSGQMVLAQPAPLAAPSERAESADSPADKSSLFAAAYRMASLSVGGITMSPTLKQAIREQLLQGFALDPSFQELEQAFPGVSVAVVDAVTPVAIRQTEETMPALIERFAALYAEAMTADEIESAIEWYGSPAYSRVNAAMESNVDLSEIIADSMTDPQAEISGNDLDKIEKSSAARSASDLTLEDKAALMRFSRTPAYAKLERLKPRAQQIEAQWTNEDSPEHDAELERVTTKALEDFTGLDLSE